jgi:hypothetical protein
MKNKTKIIENPIHHQRELILPLDTKPLLNTTLEKKTKGACKWERGKIR